MGGMPIWYELMSPDPAGVAPFYKAALGWTIPEAGHAMPGGSEYREISRADGGNAGGVLTLTPAMREHGALAGWVIYFDTADVDASVAKAEAMGAVVHKPPMTMEGIGRMAMLADPQGAAFYLMAPTPPPDQPDAQSDVFMPGAVGHCAWNELNTDDAPGQLAFYTSLFDWSLGGEMPMPEGHSYSFIDHDARGIGAIGSMKPDGLPNAWLPYFRAADVNMAKVAVEAHGGKVLMGPMEVPGGDEILVCLDPAGAALGLVSALP